MSWYLVILIENKKLHSFTYIINHSLCPHSLHIKLLLRAITVCTDNKKTLTSSADLSCFPSLMTQCFLIYPLFSNLLPLLKWFFLTEWKHLSMRSFHHSPVCFLTMLYVPWTTLEAIAQDDSGSSRTIALLHIWCHFGSFDHHSLFLLIPVLAHIFVADLVLKSITDCHLFICAQIIYLHSEGFA